MLWVRHQRRRRAGHGAPRATGGSVACDRPPVACNRQARARAHTAACLLAIFRRSCGFMPIPSYCHTPIPRVLFLEVRLEGTGSHRTKVRADPVRLNMRQKPAKCPLSENLGFPQHKKASSRVQHFAITLGRPPQAAVSRPFFWSRYSFHVLLISWPSCLARSLHQRGLPHVAR